MNIKKAYHDLTSVLRQQGFETPELDARFLLAALTEMPPAQIPFIEIELNEAQIRRLDDFRARRLRHESVARIIGTRGFWTLELELSPATLEPRPDSETLIEAALDHLGSRRHDRLKIADLGTGSGALLLALLHEFPNAFGVGIDISEAAIHTARRNAQKNNLGARARFICGNWLEAFEGKFDLVVANPPYGLSGEMAALPEEVRLYDPHLAIDGGIDGFEAYRAIAEHVGLQLDEDGLLLLEAGDGQAADIMSLFARFGHDLVGVRNDLAGRERAVVFAHRQSKKKKSGIGKNRLEKSLGTAMTMAAP